MELGGNLIVTEPPFETELYRRYPLRFYPYPPVGQPAGAGSAFTTASGALTSAQRQPVRQLGSGTAVAFNNFIENGEVDLNTPQFFNASTDGKTFWGRPKRYRALMHPVASAGSHDQQAQCGFGIGQFLVPQSEAFCYTALTADSPIVNLYIRFDTMSWESLTFNGKTPNTAANRRQVNALVGVPAPALGVTQRVEIVYQPGEYLAFLVDGIEGFRQTDPARLPDPTAPVPWVGAKYWALSAATFNNSQVSCAYACFECFEYGWP